MINATQTTHVFGASIVALAYGFGENAAPVGTKKLSCAEIVGTYSGNEESEG